MPALDILSSKCSEQKFEHVYVNVLAEDHPRSTSLTFVAATSWLTRSLPTPTLKSMHFLFFVPAPA